MVDYVIVGGGVYGMATAWMLATRGASVRVLEARSIGSGASSGPGKRGVRANGRDARELPLIRRALEIWPKLHLSLGTDPLFEKTGHFMLIEREGDLAPANARVLAQNQLGTRSSLLTGAALREFEPDVSDAIIAAIHCPDDGVADHTATTDAYAAVAAKAGAEIDEGVAAFGFVPASDRIEAVITDRGERIAVERDVLVLANPAVAELISDWIALPVWNMPFQVLVSEPMDHVPVRHLIGHAHRTLSLKPEPGKKLMISGGHAGDWDAKTETGRARAAGIAANMADAAAAYPALEGLAIEEADVSHLESVCIDGIPIIDRVPGQENLLFAAGWSGHGWAIAPAVAELLAEWVLEGTRPVLLAPFSCERFKSP